MGTRPLTRSRAVPRGLPAASCPQRLPAAWRPRTPPRLPAGPPQPLLCGAVEPRSSPRRGGGSASLPSAPPRAFGSPRPAPNRGSRAASCPLWSAGFGVSIDVTAVRRGDTGRLASARRKGSRWQGYSEATK